MADVYHKSNVLYLVIIIMLLCCMDRCCYETTSCAPTRSTPSPSTSCKSRKKTCITPSSPTCRCPHPHA